MAPVKPMGIEQPKADKGDARVGFPQEYNQEPPRAQDLNPDAVVDPSVLLKPKTPATSRTSRASKTGKAKK